MKSVALLLFSMSLVASEIALAHHTDTCTPLKIHRETYPHENSKTVAAAMRSHVTLSPDWGDARILAAFGFTHAKADDAVQGADGTQANYHVRKTRISIVRSVSTGLVVRVSHGRYVGDWIVEPCH
jgi:hypothetical protein